MAKALTVVAFCLLCFVGFAYAEKPGTETFSIEGRVYCDTCQVKFETKVSYPIQGAGLKLVCRNVTTEEETMNLGGIFTDSAGKFSIVVDNDHSDEICDVIAVYSPDPKCNKIVPEIDSSRVALSMKSGIVSNNRFTNPIGFVAAEPLSSCKEVLDELGFVPHTEDVETDFH